MAYREAMTSLEVCNNAYEWNEKSQDPEAAKGMKGELESYVDFDYDEICTPSIYQRIFSRKQSEKTRCEEQAVTSQPSRVERKNHHDNTHNVPRSMEKPSSHLVMAVSSLFICIFCWPAAPCAVLATMYGMQVGHYWMAGHHHQARSASSKAKELAMAALVCGGINAVICFLLTLTSIFIALGATGTISPKSMSSYSHLETVKPFTTQYHKHRLLPGI